MLLSLCAIGISAAPNATEVGKVAAGYTPEGTAISSIADATDPAGKYYLTADITLSATLPVTFSGTIDGNGHTITVSAPMFKEFCGTLKNATIAGSVDCSALEKTHTGAVSGYVPVGKKAVFDNVKNTASVKGVKADFTAKAPSGDDYKYRAGCGGFIGLAEGSVEIVGCANTGDITGHAAGGFVGYSEGKFDETAAIVIKNSINTGKVSDAGSEKVNNNPSVGGFVGILNNTLSATYEDLRNEGEISGLNGQEGKSATTPAGGILGYHYTGIKDPDKGLVTMKNIINTAKVTGCNQVGGIAGWIRINLVGENLENRGAIESVANYAGGLFGRTGSDGAIVKDKDKDITFNSTNGVAKLSGAKLTKCVNSGKVTSAANQAGGVVGYTNSPLECYNCTNNADIIILTTNEIQPGGILGNGGANATLKAYYCVNNGKIVSPDNYVGGIVSRVQGLSDTATESSIEKGGYVVDLRYCTNNGEVEGGKSSGGIAGTVGASGKIGLESIMYCVNTGKITNTGAKTTANSNAGASGILAYAYGNSNQIPNVKYCINTGEITAKGQYGIATDIAGYFNSASAVISGNAAVGKLSAPDSNNVFLFCWDNASALKAENVKDNYILSDNTYSLTREKKDDNVVTDTVYECIKIAAADIASGKLCYDLNAAIKAADASVIADAFYQVLGTDKSPTAIFSAKGVVEKTADGTYQNSKDPVVDPTPTGDPVLAVVAVMGVALIAVLGTAYASKKVRG